MGKYSKPFNDAGRSAFASFLAVNREVDGGFFDCLSRMTAEALDVPMAHFTLVEADKVCAIGSHGLERSLLPRADSLCALALTQDKPLILPDCTVDPVAKGHPAVAGPMGIRFYAGVPIRLENGFKPGVLAAFDTRTHAPPSEQALASLSTLAKMAGHYYDRPLIQDAGKLAEARSLAERSQIEFLALIGHELRTPLNAILGMAQVAQAARPEDKCLKAIFGAGSHLTGVIDNILALSNLVSGDQGLAEDRLALKELFLRQGIALSPLAEANGADLIFEPPPDITLRIDHKKIALATGSLIQNAVIHGGDTCRVSASRDDEGRVLYAVSDNGPGLSDSAISSFAQGTDIALDGSTGLGMPLAKRLVEMQGGSIHFRRDVGWFTVLVRLPAWRVVEEKPPLRIAGSGG